MLHLFSTNIDGHDDTNRACILAWVLNVCGTNSVLPKQFDLSVTSRQLGDDEFLKVQQKITGPH